MFSNILVATRGEGDPCVWGDGIGSVAVYSEIDCDAPYVRRADEAHLLGIGSASESYLNWLSRGP